MVNTTTTQKVLLVAFSVGFVLCEYRWYHAKEKKRVEGIFPKDDDDDGVKVIKAKKTTPAEKKKKQKREQKQSFWKEETEESESDNEKILKNDII